MRVMSKYCKAYPVGRLREFEGWDENARHVRKMRTDNGEEVEEVLDDNDILYLQEDFTVTGGIFMDEDVIFNRPSLDWTTFCKEKLNFDVLDAG
jgi:hypothetical protein